MPTITRQVTIICISLVILTGILFFGLRPKDLTLTNNLSWLENENGIHFRKYGIAFSPPFIDTSGPEWAGQERLTIEIAIKTEKKTSGSFRFLLAIDNGDESQQLLLGQWRSWLILMNGDDYAHKKKLKRLSVNTATLPDGILFLTITSGPKGTRLYCNGKTVAAKEDFTLKIPAGEKSRIIVGNSAYGHHSWEGDIYGLAIYTDLLIEETIGEHYENWAGGNHFSYALQNRPLAVYAFDEKEGEWARDLAGTAHLELPGKMKVLRRKILAPPWKNFEYNRDSFIDIVLNVIAFIPFGFFAVAALRQQGGRLKANAFHLAALLCIMTSLLIEISQSWLPSRSSTLLDLILNSLGAILGAALYGIYRKRRFRPTF